MVIEQEQLGIMFFPLKPMIFLIFQPPSSGTPNDWVLLAVLESLSAPVPCAQEEDDKAAEGGKC